MVIDTIDALDHPAGYDEFVLLSADADLTPVLLRLRAHNRNTVVYGDEATTRRLQGDRRRDDRRGKVRRGALPAKRPKPKRRGASAERRRGPAEPAATPAVAGGPQRYRGAGAEGQRGDQCADVLAAHLCRPLPGARAGDRRARLSLPEHRRERHRQAHRRRAERQSPAGAVRGQGPGAEGPRLLDDGHAGAAGRSLPRAGHLPHRQRRPRTR